MLLLYRYAASTPENPTMFGLEFNLESRYFRFELSKGKMSPIYSIRLIVIIKPHSDVALRNLGVAQEIKALKLTPSYDYRGRVENLNLDDPLNKRVLNALELDETQSRFDLTPFFDRFVFNALEHFDIFQFYVFEFRMSLKQILISSEDDSSDPSVDWVLARGFTHQYFTDRTYFTGHFMYSSAIKCQGGRKARIFRDNRCPLLEDALELDVSSNKYQQLGIERYRKKSDKTKTGDGDDNEVKGPKNEDQDVEVRVETSDSSQEDSGSDTVVPNRDENKPSGDGVVIREESYDQGVDNVDNQESQNQDDRKDVTTTSDQTRTEDDNTDITAPIASPTSDSPGAKGKKPKVANTIPPITWVIASFVVVAIVAGVATVVVLMKKKKERHANKNYPGPVMPDAMRT